MEKTTGREEKIVGVEVVSAGFRGSKERDPCRSLVIQLIAICLHRVFYSFSLFSFALIDPHSNQCRPTSTSPWSQLVVFFELSNKYN